MGGVTKTAGIITPHSGTSVFFGEPWQEVDTVRLVSVIIPCYRHGHFLHEAIDSVLRQTYRTYEILVVDDGSPDDTEKVARAYPEVQYIRQGHEGPAAARNRGIQASKGELLVFLDADDQLLPNHFAISLQAFHKHPEVAMVCGTYGLFGTTERYAKHECDPRPDHFGALLRWNFIGPPHVAMFKRTIVAHAGGLQRDLYACEDYELYLRIARQYSLHCHHQVVARYRRHETQLSQQWNLMLSSLVRVLKAQRTYLTDHPAYHEGYRIGLCRAQSHYGVPLAWQMIRHVRARKWDLAWQDATVLWQCYPQGFLVPLQATLRRRFGTGSWSNW